MAREIINLGSAPGAGDGDTAREGGGKINRNFEEVYGLIDILTRLDIIIEAAGFSLAGNDLTVNAGWQWYINNELYANIAAVLFEDIALSASGNSRLVYVVPNAEHGFTMIDGDETTGTPSTPELPNGGMYVTYFTVTDSGIGTPADPYSGDSLVNKEDKSNKNQPSGYAGLDGDGKVFGLENVDNTADIDKPVSTDVQAALDLKLNTADYNDRFKGKFLTEAAMRVAYPTANVGDEAQVNEVGSETVKNFSWDDELNDWVQGGSGGSGATNTDALPEGSSNLYFTTARVLATALAGLSAVAGTFTSSDSLLTAFGKIKYLIDNIASTYQAILTDVNFGSFINGLTAKTTPVDADSISIVDSADSNKQKKVSLTNFKAFFKTYFDGLYLVPQITITTSVSITTASNDTNGFGQKGRNVIIDNSTNAINITVNGGTDFVASYLKHGTGAITFVQGSGRTLAQVDGTAVLNGAVGSTATISSIGTKDYLRISNA